MILSRLRGAALGGLAVLLIGGAGVTFAAGPTPAAQVISAPAVTTSSQVDVQQGDQTAPDAAGAMETAGAEAPESATEPAGTATGTETEGPGGHQDANGANVDNQFQGQQ